MDTKIESWELKNALSWTKQFASALSADSCEAEKGGRFEKKIRKFMAESRGFLPASVKILEVVENPGSIKDFDKSIQQDFPAIKTWLLGLMRNSEYGIHKHKDGPVPLDVPIKQLGFGITALLAIDEVDAMLKAAEEPLEWDEVLVEYWHTHNTGKSLHEFMGLSMQDYAAYSLPGVKPQIIMNTNKPLSAIELECLDGEPVWVESEKTWFLVDVKDNELRGNELVLIMNRVNDAFRYKHEQKAERLNDLKIMGKA